MELTNNWIWWVAALVVTGGVAAYSYWRNRRPISGGMKILLTCLRLLAIGLILFCLLLEPKTVTQEKTRRRANLLVLADTSQSMTIEDIPRGGSKVSRIQSINSLFVDSKNGILSKLAERFDTIVYRFDAQCEGINLDSESTSVSKRPLQANGTLTDVGGALSKAVDDWRGQPIGGIVLLTDGRNNMGKNPLDVAKSINVPIYSIGVGDKVAPKDVRVTHIETSPVAYVDHAVPVRVSLHNSGYDGERIQVSLRQGQTVVDSTFVTLSEATPEQTLDFEIKPTKEGNFSYTVEAPALPGELTTENNLGTFFVKAIKAKLKVLLIDSRPRWEYAFLKRTLERDPNIEAAYILISQKSTAQLRGTLLAKTQKYYPHQRGLTNASRFPTTERELNTYDVLIFGDVPAKYFSQQQQQMMLDFVEQRGKAVIFLGGKNVLGRSGWVNSALHILLPVIVPTNGSVVRDEDFNPSLTAEGLYHPITRLGDTRETNESAWRDLPPLTRLYSNLQPRAGATVLTTYRNPQTRMSTPIIAFQRYGNGKSLLIAADSLWNWAFGVWAFKDEANYYPRFWSQAIRWMATRADAKLVNVETNKRVYDVNEEVHITARVYDESYLPARDAQLSLEISPPTGAPFQIPNSADSEIDGLYTARFRAQETGTYELTASGKLGETELGADSVDFAIQTPRVEFDNPQLNEELLQQLATASGGVYMPLEEIDALPSKIPDAGETITTIHENELWDSPIILILAVGILGAEWMLRKRKGLV